MRNRNDKKTSCAKFPMLWWSWFVQSSQITDAMHSSVMGKFDSAVGKFPHDDKHALLVVGKLGKYEQM